jgi:hypothetical protein
MTIKCSMHTCEQLACSVSLVPVGYNEKLDCTFKLSVVLPPCTHNCDEVEALRRADHPPKEPYRMSKI